MPLESSEFPFLLPRTSCSPISNALSLRPFASERTENYANRTRSCIGEKRSFGPRLRKMTIRLSHGTAGGSWCPLHPIPSIRILLIPSLSTAKHRFRKANFTPPKEGNALITFRPSYSFRDSEEPFRHLPARLPSYDRVLYRLQSLRFCQKFYGPCSSLFPLQ